MDPWHVGFLCLIVVGELAALNGLHRLGLWLGQRGWLHYKRKNPSSGSAVGCFVALQQVLEPADQTRLPDEGREWRPRRRRIARSERPAEVGLTDVAGPLAGIPAGCRFFKHLRKCRQALVRIRYLIILNLWRNS